MPTNKKQKMDWLFNQNDAMMALNIIGARELTTITAITIESGKEVEHCSYSKMVEHKRGEAEFEAMKWMSEMIDKQKKEQEFYYMYFRFKRF